MLTLLPTLRIREHCSTLYCGGANTASSGDTLKIVANGTFSEDVEEGAKVFLQVKYGLITLLKQEADLCENIKRV